jgi:hypothetical protein
MPCKDTGDAAMTLSFWILPILLGWVSGLAADVPPSPPAEVEQLGPKEIDFSPLPTLKSGRYKLFVQCEAGAESYSEEYKVNDGITAEDVRGLAEASFKSAGWDVKEGDGLKLIIRGKNQHPVGKLTIRLEVPEGLKGISQDDKPTVRPVK